MEPECYRVHSSEVSHANPLHNLTLSKFHFNIILHLNLFLQSGLVPSGFQTEIYGFLISLMRAACLSPSFNRPNCIR
jgi:hypothetical protein